MNEPFGCPRCGHCDCICDDTSAEPPRMARSADRSEERCPRCGGGPAIWPDEDLQAPLCVECYARRAALRDKERRQDERGPYLFRPAIREALEAYLADEIAYGQLAAALSAAPEGLADDSPLARAHGAADRRLMAAHHRLESAIGLAVGEAVAAAYDAADQGGSTPGLVRTPAHHHTGRPRAGARRIRRCR